MELFLIRHAQSINNSLPESQRIEDPALTDLGHRQAAALAEWIGELRLTKIITSPFRRALETTAHLHRATNLAPEVWIDLHEQGGCMRGPEPSAYEGRPGLTDAEIRAEFPDYELIDPIDHRGWWCSKPHESTAQATERAARLIRRTRETYSHTQERVAFVMHADFKWLFVNSLLAEHVDRPSYLDPIYNTSVTKFSLPGTTTKLEFYNKIEHLSRGLIT